MGDPGEVAGLLAEVPRAYGRLDALFNRAGVDGAVGPLTEQLHRALAGDEADRR